MTGFTSCQWCGARCTSPAGLEDHLTRCKHAPPFDDHVDQALAIAGAS